jgi:ectoine hydroxylase-related dioxygenase (phytanoyl-CoA dioxygenase family)
MTSTFAQDGFEIIRSAVSRSEVEALRKVLTVLDVAPGHRRLMQLIPEIAALAVSSPIANLLRQRIGGAPFPVRSIFFDKTPGASWLVPWHQDLSIAVQKRRDVEGYGPWSVKDGVPHVQPPVAILEQMITLRLHLDDCDESNGALQVTGGSHQRGRLTAAAITAERSRVEPVTCSAQAGDVLFMRPLLLHASSPAKVPSHRRVVHLEYATGPLADDLEWAEGPCPPAS